jgi:hypothetical protein
MDNDLKNLISLAKQRGSKFIKKSGSPDEFSERIAELGVYLLCEHDRLSGKEGKGHALEELNELHKKIDHFRQEIFALKRKIME